MTQKSPTEEDVDRLARQWLVAVRLVEEHTGESLDQSTADLARLQRLLDLGLLTADRTWELQCLGVAMGRVLARNVPGLDWAIVEDECGRDPTIRFRESSLRINVLTMISKRVEAGKPVSVAEMYEWIRRRVEELEGQVEGAR